MALINQSQVIDNVKSVSVSIHEQKIEHIDPSQYASDITEILVDYRPVEFSEKNPPKPQLEADAKKNWVLFYRVLVIISFCNRTLSK